jgi:glycine/D-amino acid oxidase-like deaminating enzyme
MTFDKRQLLHYFCLLPNKHFLFGMRGGLFSTRNEDNYIAQLIRRNFNKMFAAWKDMKIDYEWSGLACLNQSRLPFVGPIPQMKGAFTGFFYHGNGISMGTYSVALLSDLAMGQTPSGPYSSAMHQVPQRFPFGRYRQQILRPIYQWKAWQDR